MCTALIVAAIVTAALVWSPLFRQACLAAALLFVLIVFTLVSAASPAEARWYFKNYCAWDISAGWREQASRHSEDGAADAAGVDVLRPEVLRRTEPRRSPPEAPAS